MVQLLYMIYLKGYVIMIFAIMVIAYLLGSIPTGLIVGKVFQGKDIREHGSGNLGATNTFRVIGIKGGIVVTVVDILKGTAATMLPMLFSVDIHPLIPGVLAVIGHMFPIFASFKGGKAVATSVGILLGVDPILFIVLILSFLISLKLSKYVSLSSMICGVVAFTYSLMFGDNYLIIVVFLLASFVIYRHRANISRIKNKTEPKVTWLDRKK